jgi:transglutaminase-like putative cysteine protease
MNTVSPDSSNLAAQPSERVVRTTHETRYRYLNYVESSYHIAMLHPRQTASEFNQFLPTQNVQSFELKIDPLPLNLATRLDAFGNTVHEFEILHPHRVLTVTAQSSVRVCMPYTNTAEMNNNSGLVESYNPALFSLHTTPPWESIVNLLKFRIGQFYHPESQFAFPSPRVPLLEALRSFAKLEFWPSRPIGEAAYALMGRLYREYTYESGATSVHTPIEEVIESKEGVCQDFAHVMIGALRALGLACRYVSGYLMTLPAPGQEKLIGVDASHAWVSVWTGDIGWLDLDPTNDQIPDTRYMTLAVGRDYGDVSPLKGVIHGGGSHDLRVAVTVM